MHPRNSLASTYKELMTMTLQDRIGAGRTNRRKCGFRLNVKLSVCLLVLCVVTFGALVTAKAQDEDTTRRLWDTAFINSGNKKTSPRKTAKRSYRVATPNVPTAGVNADTV